MEPSLVSAAHPSEVGARTDPGRPMEPSLESAAYPKREHEPTQKGRNMKGAQQEPSFLAAAHPFDPGNMKGAQWEPSSLAAAHPSDPGAQKTNMKGIQWEPNFFAAADPGVRVCRARVAPVSNPSSPHTRRPLWTVQGLLLVDRSKGRFRQAMELTSEDCQWRSKNGHASWSVIERNASLSLLEGGEYVTGFEYVNEKHVNLGIHTPHGKKDVLVLNTVCMSGAINLRVSPRKAFEAKFLTGQIQAGNAKSQERFPVEESWESLGGHFPKNTLPQIVAYIELSEN
ncbi:hypothetical protein AK812_SmicGene27035 [Symbiodinium microadriaticum]|uniref:Uncharacterized protein n=1 Tax=Symbiodinium microadriaticum TaxID=2951 RepID=A0A1Q9D7U2_SYMMI|nr:hypothetical protein AK812_SmicGene27035 [Symbiodinium microadriaticum]